ncbi:MAG: AAA family ATPase [Chloroflexota bacterium]|nr:AAA family ATPase [Chloroflexota bacterium]MDP9459464.1 AAA family ATPase [Actinomycetota bacterium]
MTMVDPWDGRRVTVDPFADVPPPDRAPDEKVTLPSAERSRLRDGGSFVLDAPERVPAVWGVGDDVLWAQGEALMLVGPPGVGKTTLGGQLVRARLGLSDAVLGLPVRPGRRRVLYLAMDRPQQIARGLRRIFTPDERDVLDERLAVWTGPPPADLAQDTGTLAELARSADADTVVVDSVKDAALGLTDDQVGAGYNRARQQAIAAGVEILELHHQVKRGANGGPPNTLADVYGSAWITAGAGSVLLLSGAAGDPIVELRHLKQPASEVGPLQVMHDHTTGTSEIWQGTDLLAVACASPNGITSKAAACALFSTEKPTPAEEQKARRKLDNLVKSGDLHRRDGSPGGPHGSTPATWHDALTLDLGATA